MNGSLNHAIAETRSRDAGKFDTSGAHLPGLCEPDAPHADSGAPRYFETRDPGEMNQLAARSGWDLSYTQLHGGDFLGRYAMAKCDQITVQWQRRNRAMHMFGSIREGLVPMALVVSADDAGVFQGQRFTPGDLLCLWPGPDCDAVTPPGMEALGLHASAVTVTGVAMAHGFSHLGRFSSNYQTMFGVLPRESLRNGKFIDSSTSRIPRIGV